MASRVRRHPIWTTLIVLALIGLAFVLILAFAGESTHTASAGASLGCPRGWAPTTAHGPWVCWPR